MLASLLGVTMAFVLQQGDVQRQHLEFSITCVYCGDDDSISYMERHFGDYITPGVDWRDSPQYPRYA